MGHSLLPYERRQLVRRAQDGNECRGSLAGFLYRAIRQPYGFGFTEDQISIGFRGGGGLDFVF